jgi:hypothetical protein
VFLPNARGVVVEGGEECSIHLCYHNMYSTCYLFTVWRHLNENVYIGGNDINRVIVYFMISYYDMLKMLLNIDQLEVQANSASSRAQTLRL